MELGEMDEASGDLVQHFDSLEFGSFQTDLCELDNRGPDTPERPQDVVPSPSEAVDLPIGSFVDLPAGAVQHDEFQSSKVNFSNLLTHAMRDTAASSFVLPWETDEWSCIFNPDSDIMDTLLPSFEPKLKAVKLNPVDEEVVAVVARDGKPQAHLGKPFFQAAVSRRHDMMWTEKREAELQRALKKWYAIVCNWPDSWSCKRELHACATSSEGLELLGNYLTGKAPATLVKRANSLTFMQNMLQQLEYFWPMSEPDFYRFLKTLKSAGHSTSRLKTLQTNKICRYGHCPHNANTSCWPKTQNIVSPHQIFPANLNSSPRVSSCMFSSLGENKLLSVDDTIGNLNVEPL
jgi:hypothetical protein